MKKLIYIFIIGLLTFSSCNEEVLDKAPLDVVSDDVVWGDQVLIDAYLTEAYLEMTILTNETPNADWASSDDWNGPFIVNELSDECTRNWIHGQSDSKMWGILIGGGILEWWEPSYKVIRSLNEFITRIENAPVKEDFKIMRAAEARFLRAYNYFSMVKRYGGVPLITVAQDINASEEELFRKRDKEQVVYDFVISEMDAIANDLPEKAAAEYGRPSKTTALALKSRAALYAGSIAQFGTVQSDGLVGIDGSKASSYYQQAYDAAKTIINSGSVALYNVDADKVKNFKDVFLVKNNSEVIWAKRHDNVQRNLGGNGWIWDFYQCPKPHGWNAGNQNAPYLEMAEEFEHVDGTPGYLDWDAIQQGIWTTDDLWANKDPRFYATIYTQNTPWKGGKVDFHNGLLLPNGTIKKDGSHEGILAKGTQAVDGSFGTGFGVMKYLDENKDNMGERATSSTDWQLFRYAEVLLNYAEAAFELGKAGDALDAVNQIRSRAGIALLTSVDREKIRHERKVELAFEGHRYWDARRWRIAVDEFSVNRSGLKYILDFASGNYKLQVLTKYDGAVASPVFYERMYYMPITKSRTGNNPNLVENPGYE